MLFSTYLELFPMDMYFWLLLGITAATVRQYEPDHEHSQVAAPRPAELRM
jgi:hypothetical protein